MTQKEMAKCLGVTYQQVQKYENGRTRLTLEHLFKIADVLNIPPHDVIQEIGTSPPTPAFNKQDKTTIRICRQIASITDTALKKKIGRVIAILAE